MAYPESCSNYGYKTMDENQSTYEIHDKVSHLSGHKVILLFFFLLYRLLATCSADHTIKIWNTSTNPFTLEKTLTGHQSIF